MNEANDRGFALPAGTVTLLLADIEGSTRLWEQQPEVMAAAIARLDVVVAEMVGRSGGVRPIEQGEGDSFVAAFARASDAVTAALELQLADLAPLRLRIGIHTGEVQMRDEGNYVGSTVNRCARLRNLGHGGQTLLSGATHDLVVDRLPPECWLEDLGTHRLRDLARPERVHQLQHPELSASFPTLRSLDTYRQNLPLQLTTFVGRQRELSEVGGLLADERLVTLTGSGGCGKTRLALQAAADDLECRADGVWLVELAPVTDPDRVGPAVVRALGLEDEPFRSPIETIAHHCRPWSALVILDNCEHVVEAAATVAQAMLRACPSIAILATSREPLGVEGEVTWRVPSLSLPMEGHGSIDAIGVSEAVELFVERARRVRPGFALTGENATPVQDICRRLDGIPLAIELAAARVRVLSPDRIASSLSDCFRVLAGGARTAVPRQQTLRASVEWSHDLLSEPERTLFRRLGVFAGSFELDAAESICAGDGLADHHVFDQVALLVDKSLVVAVDSGSDTRYRLLEVVRQYAVEQLGVASEADSFHRRHVAHYVAFAHALSDGSSSDGQYRWLDRMELELDNLRSAMNWARNAGLPEELASLALHLHLPLVMRGYQGESNRWLEAALERRADLSHDLHLRVLCMAAQTRSSNFLPGGLPLAREALDLLTDDDDPVLRGWALGVVAQGQWQERGEYQDIYDESERVIRAHGTPFDLSMCLMGRASTTLYDDPRAAFEKAQEAVELAQAGGDAFMARANQQSVAVCLIELGRVSEARILLRAVVDDSERAHDRHRLALCRSLEAIALGVLGEYDAARLVAAEGITACLDIGMPVFTPLGSQASAFAALGSGTGLDEAIDGLRESWVYAMFVPGLAEHHVALWALLELAAGDLDGADSHVNEGLGLGGHVRFYRALVLLAGARVALARGEHERAEELTHEAIAMWSATGAEHHLAESLETLATVAAQHASHQEAARLLGAAAASRARTGVARFAVDLPVYDTTDSTLRAALRDDFEPAFAEGSALSFTDAVEYTQRGRGERKRPSTGWLSLTPTELAVARMVGDGLSNKEIGERMFISPRTVQTHLTHMFAKLGVGSRGQLAAEFHRREAQAR